MKAIRSNKKGFGIHSPFVYRLVTRVLFVDAEFYDFEEIEKLQMNKEEKEQLKLLFRLLNFFQPEKVLYFEKFPGNVLEILKKAAYSAGFLWIEQNQNQLKEFFSENSFSVFNEDQFNKMTVFPEKQSVWFIKKKNNSTKTGHFFQPLPESERGKITIELENAGIVIFDDKFPAQDYVIK